VRYWRSTGLRVVLLAVVIAFLSGAGSATAGYAAPAAGPITGSTYTPLRPGDHQDHNVSGPAVVVDHIPRKAAESRWLQSTVTRSLPRTGQNGTVGRPTGW
jgi:hypothetical protein